MISWSLSADTGLEVVEMVLEPKAVRIEDKIYPFFRLALRQPVHIATER